jgi:hypothetical protein
MGPAEHLYLSENHVYQLAFNRGELSQGQRNLPLIQTYTLSSQRIETKHSLSQHVILFTWGLGHWSNKSNWLEKGREENVNYPNAPFNYVAKDKLKYTYDVVTWSFVCLCDVEHHVAHASNEKCWLDY